MKEIKLVLTEPQRQFVFSEARHPGLVAGYGAGKRPRSATVVVTRKDGGTIAI